MNLTQDEMVMACGGLLWAFNISFKHRADGTRIPVDTMASNSLLIVKPDPFEVDILPRNQRKAENVRAFWAESDARDNAERTAFLEKAARDRWMEDKELRVEVNGK